MVDEAGEIDPDAHAPEPDAFDLVTFTDDELTKLALEAEPFDPFDPAVEQCAKVDPFVRKWDRSPADDAP